MKNTALNVITINYVQNFITYKKNIDNKDYTCKECKKKQKRRYLNENRDKVNDRRRKYHRDITKTNQIMRIIKVVK